MADAPKLFTWVVLEPHLLAYLEDEVDPDDQPGEAAECHAAEVADEGVMEELTGFAIVDDGITATPEGLLEAEALAEEVWALYAAHTTPAGLNPEQAARAVALGLPTEWDTDSWEYSTAYLTDLCAAVRAAMGLPPLPVKAD